MTPLLLTFVQLSNARSYTYHARVHILDNTMMKVGWNSLMESMRRGTPGVENPADKLAEHNRVFGESLIRDKVGHLGRTNEDKEKEIERKRKEVEAKGKFIRSQLNELRLPVCLCRSFTGFEGTVLRIFANLIPPRACCPLGSSSSNTSPTEPRITVRLQRPHSRKLCQGILNVPFRFHGLGPGSSSAQVPGTEGRGDDRN